MQAAHSTVTAIPDTGSSGSGAGAGLLALGGLGMLALATRGRRRD